MKLTPTTSLNLLTIFQLLRLISYSLKKLFPPNTLVPVLFILDKFVDDCLTLVSTISALPLDIPANTMSSDEGWAAVIKLLGPHVKLGLFGGRQCDSLNHKVNFFQYSSNCLWLAVGGSIFLRLFNIRRSGR